jgi:hypothetical protein
MLLVVPSDRVAVAVSWVVALTSTALVPATAMDVTVAAGGGDGEVGEVGDPLLQADKRRVHAAIRTQV